MTEKENLAWFETFKKSHSFERFSQRPVAYFCAEYALENRIPTYSGGLGILAGDVLREAADRGLPLVAIGLYYHLGYQHLHKASEARETTEPGSVGLELAVRADGSPLTVNVPIQDREVAVRAWRWKRHGLTTYLLDTDIESNPPGDRTITDRLYVGDKETRLKQELVLGIGGLRLLEALDIHPSVYHLNEGHSAFLSYELVRHEMQERKLGFDEAKQYARRRIVLTNHTLVPAGNEIFSNDLVGLMLTRFAKELQVPVSELIKLGLVQQSSSFSMTMLAFRMSSIINSVSKLHARKAKEIWTDHPMVAVTNGVHLPTWDRFDGKDFASPGAFWKEHQAAKERLLKLIDERAGRKWDKDTLLLGWARRITGYKRPLAAIDDIAKFAALARNSKRPVRIVFAGLSHPSDTDGQAILAELRRRCDEDLKDVACFIPGYNIETAQQLVVGCDVWLNTPVVGFEACGTSGMKAALGGALPCSTKDGWIDEVDTFKVGWLIESSRVTDDFLRLLEKEIAPMYYERNRAGVPELWEEHMRNSRQLIRDKFSATRMLKEYIEMLYT